MIGHALYFGLAWGVAAWFGVEGTSFLINHWFAITVFGIITWPLSVSFTGFNSVASLWEAWMLIKSPERWALNHLRIKKETPEYKTLLEVGNSLRSTYEKTGFFRMILAHNKYNFEQSQKSLREGPLFFFISPYSFAHIIGHAIVGLLMGLTWEKGTNIFSKNPTFIFSSSPSRWGEGFIAMGGIVAEIILGSLSIFLLWSGTWGEFTIPAKIIGIVGHLSGVGYIYTGLINKKQMEPANKGNRFFARTAEEAQNEITNRKRAFSDYRSDLHKIFIALFQPDGRTDRIFMTPLAQDSNSPGTPLHGDEKQKSDSKAQTFDSSEVRAITINMAAVREPHSLDEFDGRAYRWALLSPTLQQENEASLAKRLAPIINLKHLTLKGVFASLAILFARGEPAPSAARVAIPENLLNNQKSLAKIVTGTNLVHRGNLDVVFLVDNKENAIRFKRLHPKLKVVVAVGLFSGESQLNLAAFEPHLPLPGREVTLYKPRKCPMPMRMASTINASTKTSSSTWRALAQLMNRLWRIAKLITKQA
jgi:hypothetical protein